MTTIRAFARRFRPLYGGAYAYAIALAAIVFALFVLTG
jgi:hypothetical protein